MEKMMLFRIPRPKQSEKGQSLMELAVGLIVLLILVAGIVDLGRLLFLSISIRDATQEGAVYGQINPRSCAQIAARVINYLGANPGSPNVTVIVGERAGDIGTFTPCADAAAAVAPNDKLPCRGNDIKVEVIVPFSFSMPVLNGQGFDLRSSITGTILTCPPKP